MEASCRKLLLNASKVLLQCSIDSRMEEVADVFALLHCPADEGGTDFKNGRSGHGDLPGKVISGNRIAGTRIDQDAIFGKNALRLIPAGEVSPVVRPHNEMEHMLGIGLLQSVQRMDGVGRAGQMEFEIGGAELGIANNGKLHQLQAEFIVHQLHLFLERVVGGDHKPYFVQALVFAKIIGESQVSDVDRIE